MGKITEEKHGMSKTTTYKSWQDMKSRCTNPNNKQYHDYGGRGIKICEEWKVSFMKFLADMGEKPTKKHTLDRINNNGNYEACNCRWALRNIQNRNRRDNVKYKGETASEASIRLGGGVKLVSKRISDGWSIKKAFTTPVKKELKYKGETASEASRRLGGHSNLIAMRINQRGWSKKKAFTTPNGTNHR